MHYKYNHSNDFIIINNKYTVLYFTWKTKIPCTAPTDTQRTHHSKTIVCSSCGTSVLARSSLNSKERNGSTSLNTAWLLARGWAHSTWSWRGERVREKGGQNYYYHYYRLLFNILHQYTCVQTFRAAILADAPGCKHEGRSSINDMLQNTQLRE